MCGFFGGSQLASLAAFARSIISGVASLALTEMSTPSHMYRSPPVPSLTVPDWSIAHTSKEGCPSVCVHATAVTKIVSRANINLDENLKYIFILLYVFDFLKLVSKKDKKKTSKMRSHQRTVVFSEFFYKTKDLLGELLQVQQQNGLLLIDLLSM
ncbi:hypothetical protein M1N55_05245 [Dehalococcoidia bacterium]|nr:hypothetical protein [Dehalococcoidia bacterium]